MGNVRSRDAFRPIAREQKYLMDYKAVHHVFIIFSFLYNELREFDREFYRNVIFDITISGTDDRPAPRVVSPSFDSSLQCMWHVVMLHKLLD